MREFRTLVAWQKARTLTTKVYRATRTFPDDERFGLTSQIRRAVVSIASNLAEGCGRDTDPDYLRFVSHASGSAYEVDCQILLSRDLGFLSDSTADELEADVREVRAVIGGLSRSLKTRIQESRR